MKDRIVEHIITIAIFPLALYLAPRWTRHEWAVMHSPTDDEWIDAIEEQLADRSGDG